MPRFFFFVILFVGQLFLTPQGMADDSDIKVALSWDMLGGLPEQARCFDKVDEVFDNMDVDDLPWRRILHSLESGSHDLTPCIFKTPERSLFLDFHGPIAYIPIVMVTRDNSSHTLDDIRRLSGVFLQGTSLIQQYTTRGMDVHEVSKIDTILTLLRLGRGDYSIMPGNYVEARDKEGLSVSTINFIPLYVGVSRKSPRKMFILKALLEKILIQPIPELTN